MEKIQPGKYVEMVYDLFKINPDGTETLMHQVDAEDPEAVILGVTPGIVEPLEKALHGLGVGDEFDVVATAEQAYGDRSDEYIVTLDKELFEVDGKFDEEVVKIGSLLPMMTADGFKINGKVVEIGPDTVTMDFNHPLAGSSVRLRGKVTEVRDAKPEEIKFYTEESACGCGCSCSDGCDCSEESNCGSEGCTCH